MGFAHVSGYPNVRCLKTMQNKMKKLRNLLIPSFAALIACCIFFVSKVIGSIPGSSLDSEIFPPSTNVFPFDANEGYQAQYLAQGHTKLGIFDPDEINDIENALIQIKNSHPALVGIKNNGGVYNSLSPITIDFTNNSFNYLHPKSHFTINQVILEISSDTPMKSQQGLNSEIAMPLGIKSLDQLNKKYKAHTIKHDYSNTVFISFSSNLDIITVCNEYMRLDEVIDAMPNHLVTVWKEDYIRLLKKENFWYFLFNKNGSKTNYYVIYSPADRKVIKFKAIDVSTKKTSEMIWQGIILTRRPIKPFRSYSHLYSVAESENWWERLYAIDVMGILLLDKNARYGEDNFEKFKQLRQEVLKNRIQVINLLISNLINGDEDISNTVHTYLMMISGKNYLQTDINNWNKWFSEYKKNL